MMRKYFLKSLKKVTVLIIGKNNNIIEIMFFIYLKFQCLRKSRFNCERKWFENFDEDFSGIIFEGF